MFNMPIGFCGGFGRVTNASIANFPYINVLPMMMTNYGGDLQLTTIEPYAGYNTSIMFNGIAQQTYGTPGFVNSPFMTVDMGAIQQSAAASSQAMLAPIYKQYASQFINIGIATIDNAIKAYEAKIANADTTKDQKVIMEQAVKELKAKKEEFEKMKAAMDMTPGDGDTYSKSKELKEAVDALIREVNSKISAASSSSSSTQTSESESPSSESATPASEAEPASSESETPASDAAATENQGADTAIDNFDVAVLNDTDMAYKAMAGLGTNDSDLEAVIEAHSNAGTMLDLMLCYNSKYGDAKGESFIEAFMDDEDHNEACEMLPKIVNSLVARAKAMGIYDDEFRQWEIAVTRQVTKSDWSFLGLGAIFSPIDDDVVCENINKMVKRMGEKAGSRYAEVHSIES